MPEGPEVKTITSDLQKFINTFGNTIDDIEYFTEKKFIGCENISFPLKIKEVSCRGKQIWFSFENNMYLMVHLMMSGYFSLKPDKYKKFSININQNFLYFCDVRGFAKVKYVNEKDFEKDISKLALDFLNDNISKEIFTKNLQKCKNKYLVKCLMDQKSICSGVGNYLLSEILYDTKTKVEASCNEVDPNLLYNSIKKIKNLALSHLGMSRKDYRTVSGEKGTFSQCLKVYDKKTTDEGEKVIKIKGKHGRTIYCIKSQI
jgi:DNA-formamidopyrimidine glycosylase